MHPTHILLLEEDVLFRETLGRALESEEDLVIAAQCGTHAEALEALERASIDLVLLDATPGFDAAHDFVASARQSAYQGRFLLMTAAFSLQSSVQALQLGVSGIFLKGRGLGTLLRAIRLVATGEAWVERDIIQILADGAGSLLTEREQQVLRGVIDGLTNKAIAERMGVPEAAVKTALRRVFRRSGVQSRAQLIRAALDGSLGALPK